MVSIFKWGDPALGATQNICETYLAEVSQREQVPLGVLYAVGLTETGSKGVLHPYALNIAGKTVLTKSRSGALEQFNKARHDGVKLIDLGCMQINHHYHGARFTSPDQMLDPETNIVYAARYLKQLREQEGSWTMAVALYHASSRNKKAQKSYVCSVIKNLVATDFGAWTPESKAFCSIHR